MQVRHNPFFSIRVLSFYYLLSRDTPFKPQKRDFFLTSYLICWIIPQFISVVHKKTSTSSTSSLMQRDLIFNHRIYFIRPYEIFVMWHSLGRCWLEKICPSCPRATTFHSSLTPSYIALWRPIKAVTGCWRTGGTLPVNLKDPTLTLGARIKALRIRNGLKQAELAKSTGIGTTILARYEQGKILDLTPWILQKIAVSLKIDPAELLPEPEQANKKDFLDYFCPGDTWGSRLRKLRLSRNIQQKDLAEMIGISKVSVCRYEKDRSKPSKIITEKIDKILRPI